MSSFAEVGIQYPEKGTFKYLSELCDPILSPKEARPMNPVFGTDMTPTQVLIGPSTEGKTPELGSPLIDVEFWRRMPDQSKYLKYTFAPPDEHGREMAFLADSYSLRTQSLKREPTRALEVEEFVRQVKLIIADYTKVAAKTQTLEEE